MDTHARPSTTMCFVDGCERVTLAKGLCSAHYARKRRGVETDNPIRPRVTDGIDRILTWVELQGSCWNWTGAINQYGYGISSQAGKNVMAHRYVYSVLVGVLPEGLDADHICRNRRCCNPDHIEFVSRRENLLRGAGTYGLRTYCRHGHDMRKPDNVRSNTKGHKTCRACDRAYHQKLREKENHND